MIPRGQSLGVTFSAPDRDRLSYDEQDLLTRIRVALRPRGRGARLRTHTTGAESDLDRSPNRAAHGRPRGMSDTIGPWSRRERTPTARC